MPQLKMMLLTIEEKEQRILQLENAIRNTLLCDDICGKLREKGNDPALRHLLYELNHPKTQKQ